MHNLQPPIELNKDFIADGCSESSGDSITFGAGQQFQGIYDFVEPLGYRIVGGSSVTVGAAGGWITGAGHSMLSNELGTSQSNSYFPTPTWTSRLANTRPRRRQRPTTKSRPSQWHPRHSEPLPKPRHLLRPARRRRRDIRGNHRDDHARVPEERNPIRANGLHKPSPRPAAATLGYPR
jgi:hypothetical protein